MAYVGSDEKNEQSGERRKGKIIHAHVGNCFTCLQCLFNYVKLNILALDWAENFL